MTNYEVTDDDKKSLSATNFSIAHFTTGGATRKALMKDLTALGHVA